MKYFNPLGLKARVLGGMGANAFGQFVSVSIQLLTIPLFVYFWGLEKYGEWIVLSAVPVFLSLSDVGLASVVSNNMTMLNAEGKHEESLRNFQSGILLISSLCGFFLCSLILILIFFDDAITPYLVNISIADGKLIVILLSTQSVASLYTGLIGGAFRSVGRNATGVFLINFIRLGEWGVAGGLVAFGFDVLVIAISFLLSRLVGFFIAIRLLHNVAPWIKLGVRQANRATIIKLLRPALAFFSFPVGLAISLQGVTLVLGVCVGSSAVAVFTSYRTFSRILIQITTIINHAFWPEVSAAYASLNYSLLRKIYSKLIICAFFFGIVGFLFLGAIGPLFLRIWLGASVEFDYYLLGLLLASALLNAQWQVSWVFLMATNKHMSLAKTFLILSFLMLLVIYSLREQLGIYGICVVLIAFEVPLLLYANFLVVRMLGGMSELMKFDTNKDKN